MSKSKIVTKDVHTQITDLLIENFQVGEMEDEKYAKKYSGPADDATDTGQDNPFYNLSILMRIGAYCATAQRQLAKAHERELTLETQVAKNPTEKLMDAMDCNTSAIVNAEQEYLIFRDLFEHAYGSAWMGEEGYKKLLDEAFNPKMLTDKVSTPVAERAEQLLLKSHARRSGRSVEEQKVFENSVDEYNRAKGMKTILPKDISVMPKSQAQDILNNAINDAVANSAVA